MPLCHGPLLGGGAGHQGCGQRASGQLPPVLRSKRHGCIVEKKKASSSWRLYFPPGVGIPFSSNIPVSPIKPRSIRGFFFVFGKETGICRKIPVSAVPFGGTPQSGRERPRPIRSGITPREAPLNGDDSAGPTDSPGCCRRRPVLRRGRARQLPYWVRSNRTTTVSQERRIDASQSYPGSR